MRTFCYVMACSIYLFTGCRSSYHSRIPDGPWELRRIEVLRNNELKKIIDTGYQCWEFFACSMEISDDRHLQRRLKIKAGTDSFRSIEYGTGNVVDEFMIDKLSHGELELSSRKIIENVNYTVVYYLHRKDEIKP